MENKYYTPEIKEFHEGFEYEIKETFVDGTVKTKEDYDNAKWIKEKYTTRSYPYIQRVFDGENPNNLPPALRVKYLDIEDIESFGWKLLPKYAWMKTWEDLQDGATFELNTETNSFQLNYNNPKFIIIFDDFDIIFEGKIKNKSELEKLLEMLGITEDE